MLKIIRKNSWARIVSHGKLGYVVEVWSPSGGGRWINGTDYESRMKALMSYKQYSDRSGFKVKRIKHGGR